MLTRILLTLSLAFTGCASTTLYSPQGKAMARFQGDMSNVEYTGPGVTFRALTVTHSTATKAGGEVIERSLSAAGSAAIGIGTAISGTKVTTRAR